MERTRAVTVVPMEPTGIESPRARGRARGPGWNAGPPCGLPSAPR